MHLMADQVQSAVNVPRLDIAEHVEIVELCRAKGAGRVVILGCGEIGMLMGQDDLPVPISDLTPLHSDAAIDFALAEAS